MAKKSLFSTIALLTIVLCGTAGVLYFFLPVATFRDETNVHPTYGSPIWSFFLKPGSPVNSLFYIFAEYDDPTGGNATVSANNFPAYTYYMVLAGLGATLLFSLFLLFSVIIKDEKKGNIVKSILSILTFLSAGTAIAATILIMLWFPTQTSPMVMLEPFTISDMNYSYPIYASLIAAGLTAVSSLVAIFISMKKN